MKLFVRNLPYSMTEAKLRAIFEAVGKVVSVKIVTDRLTGKSRGFGFVEMETNDDADKAIRELKGKEIDGRALDLDKARDNARR